MNELSESEDFSNKTKEELLLELEALRKENELLKIQFKRDITEREKAEQALKRSEESLRESQAIAKMGSWYQDLITYKAEWSENSYTLFGLKPYEIEPDFNYLKSKVHADDLHLIDESIEKISKLKAHIDAEMRIILPDGSIKWLEINLVPIFQDDKLVALKGTIIDINQRKLTESNLKKSESYLHSVIMAIPVALWDLDKDGTILFSGGKALSQLGLKPNERVGQNVFDLYKDAPESIAAIKRGLAGVEYIHEISAGGRNWNNYYIPHFDKAGNLYGLLGVSFDLTDQKQVEIALKHAKEQAELQENLLNITGKIAKVGGWEINLKTQKLTWTKEVYKIHEVDETFAPTVEEAINFYDQDSKEIIQKAVTDSIELGIPFDCELGIITAKGNHVQVRALGNIQFDHEGFPVCIYGTFQDITDLKNIILQLKDNIAAKDKFFSIIAHDLKAPFTGYLSLMREMVEEFNYLKISEIKEYCSILLGSAINLYNLLENLLEWSQIQRGLINIKLEKINLFDKIEKNIDLEILHSKEKEIAIHNKVAEDIYVIGDRQMLSTIFRNLISNAIKFTEKGGEIEIGTVIKPSESSFLLLGNEGEGSSDGTVEIFVKDSGIGMEPKLVTNLFKIDQKVTRLGTKDETGTGLGLILCKEFIEKQAGKIRVESEIGKGSTFYFTLPVHKELNNSYNPKIRN